MNAPAAADPSELASDLSANLSSLDASATSGDLSGSAQGLIAGFAGTLASKISGLTLPGGTPIGADAANLLNTLAEAVTGGGGASATLSFPLFSDPSSVLNLLFGQDVPLIVFNGSLDLPNLSTGNTGLSDYGVEVGFNSSLSVKGALTVGYDTYGLRNCCTTSKRATTVKT